MQLLQSIVRCRLPDVESRNEEDWAKSVASKLGYLYGDHVVEVLDDDFEIFAGFQSVMKRWDLEVGSRSKDLYTVEE